MHIMLGVIDIPYSDASYRPAPKNRRIGQARRGKIGASKTPSNQKTTGDVAETLEQRYHIMETFFELNEDMIGAALEQSMRHGLESFASGAPATLTITAEAESEIEAKFRDFIAQRGMDGAVNGVPTIAARLGVSHRFLHPYAKRPSRPSFYDTGLFVANFKMWTDT